MPQIVTRWQQVKDLRVAKFCGLDYQSQAGIQEAVGYHHRVLISWKLSVEFHPLLHDPKPPTVLVISRSNSCFT